MDIPIPMEAFQDPRLANRKFRLDEVVTGKKVM